MASLQVCRVSPVADKGYDNDHNESTMTSPWGFVGAGFVTGQPTVSSLFQTWSPHIAGPDPRSVAQLSLPPS